VSIMVSSRAERQPLIQPPTNCPSCDSVLQWVKDQLYCKNNACPAQSSKQIEHFAKTLKIKGLGPSTIEKLDMSSISDVYDLSLDYLVMKLGEKTAIKLFDEIEKSKNEPLNTVLPAFGIPLIGKTATDKLATVVEALFEVDEATCKQAGLGPKATESLINWLDDKFEEICHLPFSFEFSKNTRSTGERGVVCITGKLSSYPTKAAAKAMLEGLGYIVKDTVTKEVTILVNESGRETAKTLKAAADGLLVITNLKELTENN
jgi:NAD-dependent DNA ligase